MSVLYEFGEFRLDPQRRLLVNGKGEPLWLVPRAFDALLLLVSRPGELLEKALLMKALWPRVIVADNSLDQIMSRLRRTLGESTAPSSFISTERGRGYRFVAEVATLAVPDRAATDLVSVQLPGSGAAPESRAAPPTADSQAYQLYLQARTLSVRPSPDNLRAACELLRAAIARDPLFVRAIAHLALLRTVFIAFDIPMKDALKTAEREARSALEVDPALARGHQALGNVFAARGAWNEAEQHYDAACRFEEDPDARVTRIWQLTQSVGHLRLSLQQAVSIDPLAPSQPLGAIAAAVASLLLGLDSEAERHAGLAEAFGWPRSHPALRDIHSQLAVRAGRFREAADCMSSELSLPMRAAGGAEAIELLCAALEKPDCRDGAVVALRSLISGIPPEQFGLVDRRRVLLWLTMLGALDEAFALAHASLDYFARTDMVGIQWGVLWMPEMQPFRRDPRFQDIVARLRFADYWTRHGPPDDHELQDGLLTCGAPHVMSQSGS